MRRASKLGRLFFFFFNDTATTEIYPLSLHDALPISCFALRQIARRKRLRESGQERGCKELQSRQLPWRACLSVDFGPLASARKDNRLSLCERKISRSSVCESC